MKKKLIKATVLIAIATLVMLNIQILFDTSDSTIFKGSTVMAQEEEKNEEVPMYLMQLDPSRFYQLHELKSVSCVDFDIEGGAFPWVISGIPVEIPYIKGFSISRDGEKWICKKEKLLIFCDSDKMTDCQGDKAGEESSEEDSEQ